METWGPDHCPHCGRSIGEIRMPPADHVVLECKGTVELPLILRQLVGYNFLDPDRRRPAHGPGTLDGAMSPEDF